LGFIQSGLRLRELQDPEELKLWKCELFSPKEDLFGYVNEATVDGSLTIELKVSAYLHVSPTTVVHGSHGGGEGGDDKTKTAVKELLEGEKRLLGLLLGDKSDVVISLVNDDGKEIGRFFCHSRILSGNVDSHPGNVVMRLKVECISNISSIIYVC